MALRGNEVERRVPLPSASALAGAAVVQAALRTIPKVDVATLRAGTFQTTRVYRPTWAIVLAVCLAPLLGLGLLFLFVRRTERCKFEVVESRGRTDLSISGRFPRKSLDTFLATIESPSALAERPAVRPPDSRPTISLPREASASVIASAHPGQGSYGGPALIRLDNGEVVPIALVGVVGRDPQTLAGHHNCVLVRVEDDTRSVSKSHFAFGPHEAGIWIEDLNSTNGTYLVHSDGERVRLLPGQRMPLSLGSLVAFGDRSARVEGA